MNENNKKDREGPKAYYHITSVAKMYNVHPQTLRLYEREGLLNPIRSEGNTRLYTETDLEKLKIILNLTRELGVNLAGVEVILNMREKMEQMESEVNNFLEYVRVEFFEGKEEEFERRKKSIIRISPAKIMKIEKLEEEEERKEKEE